jgi:hypothetical protein
MVFIAMLRPQHGVGRAVTGLVKLSNSCIVTIYPSCARNGKPSVMHLCSTVIASNYYIVRIHVARFDGIEDCG